MQPLVGQGLVGSVPVGLPVGTKPIGTKTWWENLSAATECAVVDVGTPPSNMNVFASTVPRIGATLPLLGSTLLRAAR